MEVTKSFGFLISGIDQLYTDASNVRVRKTGQFPQACFNICFKKNRTNYSTVLLLWLVFLKQMLLETDSQNLRIGKISK